MFIAKGVSLMTLSYASLSCQGEAAQKLQSFLEQLFGDQARQLARETGFVQRRSPIDGAAFARTLVFGFQDEPDASYTDLQQMMASQNVVVSPQAIEKRMKEPATCFLLRMVESLVTMALTGEACGLGTLSDFAGVYLQDGTRITLPDELHEVWKSTGGRTGSGGEAGVRVQVRLDMLRGELQGPWLQHGREEERSGASSIEENPLPVGSLYVTDTGYVTIKRIQEHRVSGRFFLAPASLRAKMVDQQGIIWELPALVATRAKQGKQVIDEMVFIGVQERVPCRLIAVANPRPPSPTRRDQHARRKGSRHDVQIGRKKQAKGLHGRKKHCEGKGRRQIGDWIVILTNVPAERLTAQQARELLRARWQSELLWKLWKQHGHLDYWRSEKPMRILCEMYAKLIGVTIQHWFTIVGCWHNPHRSLVKAGRAMKKLAVSVVLTLDGALDLREVITCSQRMMQRSQLNPRVKRPNTSQRMVEVFLG
jgi:Transposase DDE domain